MNIRIKVYGFVTVIALVVAGWYLVDRYTARGAAGAEPKKDQTANAKPGKGSEEVVPVELVTALQKPISSYLTATTNLRALRDVALASQTVGLVREVLAEEGDLVEKGRALCVLDDRELVIRKLLTEQRLAQARVQLEQSRIRKEKADVQIKNTQLELDRQERAYAEKLVSEREVAQLRYRLDELKYDARVSVSEVQQLTHRVEELESEIKQVELELSRTRILAPFSGYITQRTVQLGQTIRNLDSLFRLAAFSPLYADAHLSEGQAHQVRPGQGAVLTLGEGESARIEGRVIRISPIVDQATGTVKVTVELTPSSRDRFKPGAFVRVSIETDRRAGAIVIPKRAIVEEDSDVYVFVVKDKLARRKKIVLGYETGGEVEVRGGVAAGEKIVVAGQGQLKEGSKVRVVAG